MTFQITNTPSREAPNVEDGLVPAKLLGITLQSHPDWATPNGKFGVDTGERFHWLFALTDDDGDELYEDGDAVTVEGVNGTNFNTKSDKSKNAVWMKAVSPAAFAKIDAGIGLDPSEVIGAPCMLLLEIKDNGWPKIVNVLPPAKRRASRRTVEADEE